jgi:hypothetical protein
MMYLPMHDLSRAISSFTALDSIGAIVARNMMASLSVDRNTSTFWEEETGQKRRRYLTRARQRVASLVMNVRQMLVRAVEKRSRLWLRGSEDEAGAACDARTCEKGAATLCGKIWRAPLSAAGQNHSPHCTWVNNTSSNPTERKSTPPPHRRSLYLSSIVNISTTPNSDTLDRVFKWHSSAAATCARCRKQLMACLIEARSPRNLAYMHRTSGAETQVMDARPSPLDQLTSCAQHAATSRAHGGQMTGGGGGGGLHEKAKHSVGLKRLRSST